MRVLFDQGTPVPLRQCLPNHSIVTVYEQGWSRLTNGELLRVAEQEQFDVLVTTDQNIQHQQNLTNYRLAMVVLPTTSWPLIQRHLGRVSAAIDDAAPGRLIHVQF